MARSKWDEDNPTNLLKRIEVLESNAEEQQELIKALAEAILELSKEVRTNREFIEKQASLSKKTVEAIQQLTEI